MTSLDSSRREQTHIRRALRRRRRLRIGAATTLGSLAVLGVSGAALGTASGTNLRATAGIQLVNLAVPLLSTDGGTEAQAPTAESDGGQAPDAGSSESGPSTPETKAADAGAGADAADTGAGADAAGAAETTAREAAEAEARKAAEQKAADDKAAAEQAARDAAARAAVPVDDPAAAKAYAGSALASRGWDASQLSCLDRLWTKESEWLTSATNASSGAYGIAQSLPGEKMAVAGEDWKVSYQTQINWGLDYISSRYGTPCSALNFHYANNWY